MTVDEVIRRIVPFWERSPEPEPTRDDEAGHLVKSAAAVDQIETPQFGNRGPAEAADAPGVVSAGGAASSASMPSRGAGNASTEGDLSPVRLSAEGSVTIAKPVAETFPAVHGSGNGSDGSAGSVHSPIRLFDHRSADAERADDDAGQDAPPEPVDDPDLVVREVSNIDQDADIIIEISGTGRVDTVLGQEATIDQHAHVTTPISDTDEFRVKATHAANVDQDADITVRLDGAAPAANQARPNGEVTVDIDGDAILDQDVDVDVEVNGYAGPTVVRLNVDQTADLDNDAAVAMNFQGQGGIALDLDQLIRLDLDFDIDIDVFESEGVLYLDVFIRNEVTVDQDTSLSLQDGLDGSHAASIDQAVEIDQSIDVDLDVMGDLQDRYAISAAVDVQQQVDVDQDAELEIISAADGSVAVGADADQVVQMDHDVLIRLDFAVA
jgi:hypothetical protein